MIAPVPYCCVDPQLFLVGTDGKISCDNANEGPIYDLIAIDSMEQAYVTYSADKYIV